MDHYDKRQPPKPPENSPVPPALPKKDSLPDARKFSEQYQATLGCNAGKARKVPPPIPPSETPAGSARKLPVVSLPGKARRVPPPPPEAQLGTANKSETSAKNIEKPAEARAAGRTLFDIIPEAGFQDLQQAIAQLPKEAASALEEHLSRWPTADLNRMSIEDRIAFLFMDWYDKFFANAHVQGITPEAKLAVRQALDTLFASLKMRIVDPKIGRRVENPREVLEIVDRRLVAASSGMRGGEVLELLRPLLLDARGRVACRARVIVAEVRS
jgi:hypothetical protein